MDCCPLTSDTELSSGACEFGPGQPNTVARMKKRYVEGLFGLGLSFLN